MFCLDGAAGIEWVLPTICLQKNPKPEKTTKTQINKKTKQNSHPQNQTQTKQKAPPKQKNMEFALNMAIVHKHSLKQVCVGKEICRTQRIF